MPCALATLRFGVKYLCRPRRGFFILRIVFYKYVAPNGALLWESQRDSIIPPKVARHALP
jgi:hypothetical protein